MYWKKHYKNILLLQNISIFIEEHNKLANLWELANVWWFIVILKIDHLDEALRDFASGLKSETTQKGY